MNEVKSFFESLSKYLVGIAVFIGLFVLVSTQVPLLKYFFEKEGPRIELISQIDGFGNVPQDLKFKVIDDKSGIELIRVRVDQSRLNKEIYKESVPLNTLEHEVNVSIDAKKEGFKPGNIRITIEAFDRSLESNGEKFAFDLPVRFDIPDIELLSSQHNAVQGGMELVLYRVSADKIKQSGVRIADKEFIGYPAYMMDPDFESMKGVYFSFYVVPQGFQDDKHPPVVYARNSVGNEGTQTFYYKIQNVRPRSWKYQIDNLDESRFSQTNLESYLSKLPKAENRYWNEKLIKPPGQNLSPVAGDTIFITDSSGKQVQVSNELMTFKFPLAKPITMGMSGQIVSLVEGKGFKKIAVLDHGFGLTSVFTNLDKVYVNKNQEIGPDDQIAEASYLSQVKDPGFEYGLFFQGAPTRTVEWWDGSWVHDHIIQKFIEVKRRLGVGAAVPEENSHTHEEMKPIIKSVEDVTKNEENPTETEVLRPRSTLPPVDENKDFESGRDDESGSYRREF